MKILFLDCETTDQTKDEKRNPSPYLPANKLVSIGWELYPDEQPQYKFFYHKEKESDTAAYLQLQNALSQTDLFVAFNSKFDLSYLLECGFEYKELIFDPMICAYIMARGRKLPLKLDDCAIRFGVSKKSNVVQELWDKGMGFDTMPAELVEEYGRQDVQVLKELFFKQLELLGLTAEEYIVEARRTK